MATALEVRAAGAVVIRSPEPGRHAGSDTQDPEILVVHRPRYDDWSLPKGKLDPGETAPAAAVREVREETGVRIRLGVPLPPQRYRAKGRPKRVDYWIGTVLGGDDPAARPPDDEIDAASWVPLAEVEGRLSYPHDRATVRAALDSRGATWPLVVLRHADALPRKGWRGDDRLRPLDPTGREQAVAAAALLTAFGVGRAVTSASTRCVQTVAPYLSDAGLGAEKLDALTEEGASKSAVVDLVRAVRDRVPDTLGAVLCSHRPVLPWILRALGLAEPKLAKGEALVLHLAKTGDGLDIVASERHRG